MAKNVVPFEPVRRKRRLLGLDDQERADRRRQLLLDAALDYFGTRGYTKTTIEALCQSAGVGTTSFYELYANKEAIMADLYDQVTSAMGAAVAEEYLLRSNEPNLIELLITRFVHHVVADPRLARVAFIESAGISPELEEHRRRARNQFVEALVGIGSALRAKGGSKANFSPEVSALPAPRRNAVGVVGAIIEMVIDWLLDPDQDPIETLIRDVAHYCNRIMNAILTET